MKIDLNSLPCHPLINNTPPHPADFIYHVILYSVERTSLPDKLAPTPLLRQSSVLQSCSKACILSLILTGPGISSGKAVFQIGGDDSPAPGTVKKNLFGALTSALTEGN